MVMFNHSSFTPSPQASRRHTADSTLSNFYCKNVESLCQTGKVGRKPSVRISNLMIKTTYSLELSNEYRAVRERGIKGTVIQLYLIGDLKFGELKGIT